jgi:hypothetical protein
MRPATGIPLVDLPAKGKVQRIALMPTEELVAWS